MSADRHNRPHFLHLHSSFGTGGKELRCAQLINAFGPGVSHTIISGEPDRLEAGKLIEDGIEVNYPSDFPALSGRGSPARLRALAQAMQGYDLILTYNWGAVDGVMAHRLYARKFGLASLVHHEDGFNEDEQYRLKPSRNLYRRIALTGTFGLMVPSHRLEKVALDIWHQPRDKVHYTPNGIATADFLSTPQSDAIPGLQKQDGAKWVGTLAGLRKVKDLPLLVRAFAELPNDWQLVIVGEGPERETIVEQARQCGVSARVHLPGFVAHPSTYVGLFDIFALSSKSEQFPISVVEAMAAGMPVAAPDVGDIAQMVSGANRKFIGPAADLAVNLTKLANNDALRTKTGEENREKAQRQFDQKTMIAAYYALYSDAMGRTGWAGPITSE